MIMIMYIMCRVTRGTVTIVGSVCVNLREAGAGLPWVFAHFRSGIGS